MTDNQRSVVDQFAMQLALKSDNGHEYRVVWGGDYDSISASDLRKVVGNFLNAWYEVRDEDAPMKDDSPRLTPNSLRILRANGFQRSDEWRVS